MKKSAFNRAPLPSRDLLLCNALLKRGMDIAVSALLLAILLPLLAVLALLIYWQDGGPVFYRQNRLTKGGKIFQILKFRSMRPDAELDGIPRLATENDRRITPVGKFLRATHLDELPQLLNVLKGDMSLVGPRPERPEFALQYGRILPQFHARLQVKAGLTGYAQVHGHYNSPPQEKLQMDLMYISAQSISLDVKLLLQTLQLFWKSMCILFQKENTKGVSAVQSAAFIKSKMH